MGEFSDNGKPARHYEPGTLMRCTNAEAWPDVTFRSNHPARPLRLGEMALVKSWEWGHSIVLMHLPDGELSAWSWAGDWEKVDD